MIVKEEETAQGQGVNRYGYEFFAYGLKELGFEHRMLVFDFPRH
jgi:hypothetical protein